MAKAPAAGGQKTDEPLTDLVNADPRRPRVPLGDNLVAEFIRPNGVENAASAGTVRYSATPQVSLVLAKAPPLPSLPWVHRAVSEGNHLALQVLVELFTPQLLVAGELAVERDDAEYLERARANNKGRPVTVLVEPLDLKKVRLGLRRQTDDQVLGIGEAVVNKTPDFRPVQVWIRIERGRLEELVEAATAKVLVVVPTYSYTNRPMVRAIVRNVADLNIAQRFNQFLKARHLTGKGDITRADLDAFSREVEGEIRSQVVAEHPDAANGLLVNLSTLIAGAVAQRMQETPLAKLAVLPSFNRQMLDQQLKPWGFELDVREEDARIGGERKLQQSGTQLAGAVQVPLKVVTVGLGGGVSDETLRETYKQTGIRIVRDQHTNGLVITHMDTYWRVEDLETVRFSQRAEVAIGLPPLNSLFGGTPFHPSHTREAVQEVLRADVERSRTLRVKLRPLTPLLRLGQGSVSEMLQAHRMAIEAVESKRGAWEQAVGTLESKQAERAAADARIPAAREALNLLYEWHVTLDEGEANGTRGHTDEKVATPLIKASEDARTRLAGELPALQTNVASTSRDWTLARRQLTARPGGEVPSWWANEELPKIAELQALAGQEMTALLRDDLSELERLYRLRQPAAAEVQNLIARQAAETNKLLAVDAEFVQRRTGLLSAKVRLASLEGRLDGIKRVGDEYVPHIPDADERQLLAARWQNRTYKPHPWLRLDVLSGSILVPAQAAVAAENNAAQSAELLLAQAEEKRKELAPIREALAQIDAELQRAFAALQPIDDDIRAVAERFRAHLVGPSAR
jgi:hypothetical protein